jgi:hypothetical protein
MEALFALPNRENVLRARLSQLGSLWLGSARYTNKLEAQLGSARSTARAGSFGSRTNLNAFLSVGAIHLVKDRDKYWFGKSKINKKKDDLMLVWEDREKKQKLMLPVVR